MTQHLHVTPATESVAAIICGFGPPSVKDGPVTLDQWARAIRKAHAILMLHTGEEFLEFKEALSDLRSLRQEHRDLTGGGPGWNTRWEAAWAKVDELFANEDEAAYMRQQEDAHG